MAERPGPGSPNGIAPHGFPACVGRTYNSCVPQVSTSVPGGEVTTPLVDEFEDALQTVARAITNARLHERLLRSAGVRIDRAGATLLHKLMAGGDSLRITDLAELLGVDAPTVTRKVQQLEREEMIVRRIDPKDRRAVRVCLTPSGRRTIDRIRRAKRAWLENMLNVWSDEDLAMLAALLGRFADGLEQDLDGERG